MALGQYLLGAAFFLLTVGALGAAAALVIVRRLAHLPLPARGLAFALLWLAGLVLATLLPAAATILSRGSVLVTAVLVVLATWLLCRPTPAEQAGPEAKMQNGSDLLLGRVLAAVGLLALMVVVLAYLIGAARMAIEGNDYLSFTMPNLGRWIQSGSLWMSNQFTPLVQTSTYPNNGDLVFLGVLLPWHDDALVRLINIPMYALIGCSVYALAREIGAARSASILSAALVLSIQDVVLPALQDVKPDAFMLATLGIGLLFLVRHHRTRARADLVLAGLGLGLAFGARWYGISSVVALAAVWVLGSLLARRAARSVLSDAGVLCGMILLAGGFWLVRNWVVTGNPIYPVRVALLGFDAPADPFISAYNVTVAHYLVRPREFFHQLLPLYRYGIGVPGYILGGSGLVALALATVRARRASREERGRAGVVLALLAGAALILVAFTITPASAQGPPGQPVFAAGNARWAMGAAIPAAAAVAWAASRMGLAGLLLQSAALVGIAFGLQHQFPGLPARRLIEALVAIAVAGLLAWALRRTAPALGRRKVLALVGVAVVAAGVALGDVVQRRVEQTRYANADTDPVLRWLVTEVPSGHRVGIAGAWLKLPVTWAAFGPRLGNRVGYVGATVDHMLVQYAQRSGFVDAIRRGDFDLIVLGRGWDATRPFQRSSPLSPTTVAQQAAWIRSAGFRLVAAGTGFLVYARARASISATARRLNSPSLRRAAVS